MIDTFLYSVRERMTGSKSSKEGIITEIHERGQVPDDGKIISRKEKQIRKCNKPEK